MIPLHMVFQVMEGCDVAQAFCKFWGKARSPKKSLVSTTVLLWSLLMLVQGKIHTGPGLRSPTEPL